jgi:hypothetical protein
MLDRLQMLREQKPMMLPHSASESLDQFSSRATQSLASKRGKLFRILLAHDKGLQDAPPARAHDMRIPTIADTC